MHAVAVELARPDVGQVAVPDLVGVFGQGDAVGLAPAVGVEQAQFDLGGVGGEQGEIDARSVPGRAARMGQAGLDAQLCHDRSEAALYPACSKTTVASGGSVSDSEAGRPCQGVGSATTPPPLPTFEPP